MTDYSNISDFEIDKAVADAIGFEYDLAVMFVSPVDKVNGSHVEEYVRKKITNNERHWRRFSPTRSWADAGPIAERNLISLIPVNIGNGKIKWRAANHCNHSIIFADKNPCRAICIAFLMMNEGE